jgi:carboxylesterase
MCIRDSSPTTYLDELDGIYEAERFIAPNPHRFRLNKNQRLSLVGLTSSLIYLIAYNLTDFEILGLWPVVIGVSASVANLIWDTARKDDDYEDGAKL